MLEKRYGKAEQIPARTAAAPRVGLCNPCLLCSRVLLKTCRGLEKNSV